MRNFKPHIRELLDQNGFAQVPFEELRAELGARGFRPESYRIKGKVELPDSSERLVYPGAAGAKEDRFARIGEEAIAGGAVAVVVLNGGMATRFGGGTKGMVKVCGERSFLDLKIRQALLVGGGRVPVWLMNSFATHADTLSHLADLGLDDEVGTFCQNISLRLTPEGEIFLDDEGNPSLHAPGHGDFPYALKTSGVFDSLMERGVRWITLSNVDNLGACLDPVVLGMHIEGGCPITVELVEVVDGDVGGFPAVVDGHTQILEGFRLPDGFAAGEVEVFNTNTFVFDLSALSSPPALDWFAVEKEVSGRRAIQFERLVGQLTEYLLTTWLQVPRSGAGSRFLPMKKPSDIEGNRRLLEQLLLAQGLIP